MTEILGYDYIICPFTGEHLKQINVVRMKLFGINTVDEFKQKYPNYPTYCEKIKEIRKNQGKETRKQSSLKHKEEQKIKEIEYYKNPKKCVICGKIISFEHKRAKTCSRSCGNKLASKKESYSYRTPEQKEYRLEAIKNYQKSQESAQAEIRKNKEIAYYQDIKSIPNCIICGKPHSYKRRKLKTCSAECRLKLRQKMGQIKKKKAEEEYYKNPKKCSICENVIVYDKRRDGGTTCSKECEIQLYNKTELIRAQSRKDYCKARYYKNPRRCTICDNIIAYEYPRRHKTCSLKCQNAGCKRSSDEIALYKLCSNYFINVSHNTKIVEKWDADIVLNDKKIAIFWNGPWHYKDMGFVNSPLEKVQARDKLKTELFTNAGWKVIVFEDRYYTPEQAFEELKINVPL
jgi:predicted nucleic acid-binding Zn ribbon protein